MSVTYHHGKWMIRVLVSEHKLGPCVGKFQEGLDLVPQEFKHRLANIPLQNHGRKEELQGQATKHRTPVHLNEILHLVFKPLIQIFYGSL